MMFVPYVCMGDPNLEFSLKLVRALDKYSDVIELGFPFSDPIADGKTIQEAGQRALEGGANAKKIFEGVEKISGAMKSKLVVMTYFNLIYCFGKEKFLQRCKQCKISGLIIPDLPFGEDKEFEKMAKENKIEIIGLVCPSTEEKRAREIIGSSGKLFTYLVSVRGTTGARGGTEKESLEFVGRMRKLAGNKKTLCVGFGISSKEQAGEFAKAGADGAIVGSKIIDIYSRHIRGNGIDEKNALGEAEKFAKEMKEGK